VFLSSHLLSEVEQVATHIGIIHKGQMLFQGTPGELQAQLADHVTIEVDQPDVALRLLSQAGWTVRRNGNHRLVVEVNGQSDVAMINAQLVRDGINVFHLNLERPSLEDIFLKLTGEQDTQGGSK
jgi:ABC-type multidrug transport system ATPase subunit